MPPKRAPTSGRRRRGATTREQTTAATEAVEEERGEIEAQGTSPLRVSLSPPRPSHAANPVTPSPRPSMMTVRRLQHKPRFAQKRSRNDDDDDEEEEEELEEEEEELEEEEEEAEGVAVSQRRPTGHTAGSSRRSGSRMSDGATGQEAEGFFHDLHAMQPLRVRLGVCPLPNATAASDHHLRSGAAATTAASTTTTTALLLSPQKFFTLPEEKGGSDVVGWSAAFSGVSVELPSEGVYNKASVSLTVMLPP